MSDEKFGPVGKMLEDQRQGSEKLNKLWNELIQTTANKLELYKLLGWIERKLRSLN